MKYKLRKNLQIYVSKELDSAFIEVIQPGKNKNIITDCICHHPVMELSRFLQTFHKKYLFRKK